MLPVKNITGYTAASGFLTMPVTAYTPQLQVVDFASGSIIGFTPATYPAAQTTSVYAVNSNLVPHVDPTAAVVITCSNLYNPIANNNQVLHTFTSAGVEYGGLITTSQSQGLAYCPMQGTNSELTLSFLDQNMIPLGIIDNNRSINGLTSGLDRNGEKPIVFNGSMYETQDYIVDKIRTSGYAYEDIAIIGPVKTSKNRNDSFAFSVALHTLAKNEIPYLDHYSDGNGADRTPSKGIQIKNGHVNIITCHG
ncbi:unnamed protein product [Phytophthora lilii]|uniref:Unnamed protein product n=1 Tax=Phytophthora lilii TaxID=2077276 RepID=A0A9W6TRF2_9STRA|nr:unnamed protein product [Phytophthora lilii]